MFMVLSVKYETLFYSSSFSCSVLCLCHGGSFISFLRSATCYFFKTQLWSCHLPAYKAWKLPVAWRTKDRPLAKQFWCLLVFLVSFSCHSSPCGNSSPVSTPPWFQNWVSFRPLLPIIQCALLVEWQTPSLPSQLGSNVISFINSSQPPQTDLIVPPLGLWHFVCPFITNSLIITCLIISLLH